MDRSARRLLDGPRLPEMRVALDGPASRRRRPRTRQRSTETAQDARAAADPDARPANRRQPRGVDDLVQPRAPVPHRPLQPGYDLLRGAGLPRRLRQQGVPSPCSSSWRRSPGRLPEDPARPRALALWAYTRAAGTRASTSTPTRRRQHELDHARRRQFGPRERRLVGSALPPADWDSEKINNMNRERQRECAVPRAGGGGGRHRVYRQNRMVMFHSKLFHKTDEFHFAGATCRRVNITCSSAGWTARATAASATKAVLSG